MAKRTFKAAKGLPGEQGFAAMSSGWARALSRQAGPPALDHRGAPWSSHRRLAMGPQGGSRSRSQGRTWCPKALRTALKDRPHVADTALIADRLS